MCCPSASFVVWSAAWLHGHVAADDLLDSLRVWGDFHEVISAEPHLVDARHVPCAGAPAVPLARLLAELRSRGAPAGNAALVLPAPGDVRGLGASPALVTAALDAREAAVFPEIGVGIVPTRQPDRGLLWTIYPLAAGNHEQIGIGEAEHALAEAVRTSAGALTALDVARDRPDAHTAMRTHLKALPRPDWPRGMPGRSLRVLQRADEVAAILTLAEADHPGAALSATSAELRAQALRPLASAVRAARSAAVTTAAHGFAMRASGHP